MFRNKVVVRADPPSTSTSPSPSPFLSRLLHLHPPPLPARLLINIDSLCWRLSRSLHISLFFSPSLHAVCVLYKPNQSLVAAEAVDRIAGFASISDIGEEEEVEGGSLVAKAVECGLRSFFLNLGWRSVGENCFVNSSFSPKEEKRHLHAFTVAVQLEITGEILFVIRPDVIRFSRYEIADLIDLEMQDKLRNSEEVTLDGYSLATSSSVLPSLSEGHIVGLSKLLPAEVDLVIDEENWLVKYGLELTSDHFVNIQFARGSCTNMSWFPSSFVIQGAGLSPAPQSVRISEAARVLQSFMAYIKDWNFFNEGALQIKGTAALSGSELSTWTTASNGIQNGLASRNGNTLLTDLFNSSDFRTPKPALLLDSDKRVKEPAVGAKNASDVSVSSIPESACIRASNGNNPVAMPGSPSSAIVPKFSRKAPKRGKRSTRSSNTDVVDFLEPGDNHRAISSTTEKHVSGPIDQMQDTQILHSGDLESKTLLAPGFKQRRGCRSRIKNDEKSVPHANVGNLVKKVKKSENPLPVRIDGDALPKIPKAPKAKRNIKEVHADYNKRTSPREKVDADLQDIPKKKAKLQTDSSDSIAKVIDHHNRGKLESVTVVELKAFLSSRKARVGGKKEELIQRVTSLLG